MKRALKIILICLGVLVVMAIATAAVYSYKSTDKYIEKITQQAVEANDTSICHRLVMQIMGNLEYNCYSQVAIENKNLKACFYREFGREDYWMWPCFSAYFKHHQTQDSTVCDVVPDQSGKDECLFQQNLRTVNRVDVCSLIESNTIKGSCYINVAGHNKDISICATYMSGQRDADICYEHVAMALNDETICNRIIALDSRERCKAILQ